MRCGPLNTSRFDHQGVEVLVEHPMIVAADRTVQRRHLLNVVWTQIDNHLGGLPMDLGLPLEVLRKPAAP
jgi:hypothetical protein